MATGHAIHIPATSAVPDTVRPLLRLEGLAMLIAGLVAYDRLGGDWLWLVPALIVAEFLGFGLSMAVEPSVITSLFGWLPDWFIRPIDPDRVGEFSRAAWLITLAAYLALNGFIGPIVEELYFRGYLLPRMEWLGRWAPLLNVSLFSIYHFWSPWQVVGRVLALAPMVYAVRWKQNIYLGMVIHCTGNVLGIALLTNIILGRI
jgi:membrane protease YdiL (CAAX protease family)